MKTLSILLLLLVLTACAPRGSRLAPPEIPKDTSVALFTPSGYGRGCPVTGVIVTARHVLKKRGQPGFYSAWWSDRHGRGGAANFHGASEAVDGAILQPEGPQPRRLPVGTPTDDLYFFDLERKTVKNAFTSVLRRAKLVRLIGGYIIFDAAPSQGASGGCLYNSKHEAVGIVVWTIQLEGGKGAVGVGVQFPTEWR